MISILRSFNIQDVDNIKPENKPIEFDKFHDTLLLVYYDGNLSGFFLIGDMDGDTPDYFANFFLCADVRRYSTRVMQQVVRYFFTAHWIQDAVWHCTTQKQDKDVRHFVNRIGFHFNFERELVRYYKVKFRGLYVNLIRG